MKLIWHIIRKDFRRDKWMVLFWMMLFAAHLGIGQAFLNTDGSDLEWIDQLRLSGLLLTICQFAVGYLLAVRWVQADELSGTRMFWVTRPISGGRLLAAKGLGSFLIFGLVPVLLWMPWWIYCGLGAREIAWLAAETLGWQLLMIAPALLIGSLTDDFGRAIMWSLVLVVGVLAWTYLGQSTLTSGGRRQFTRVSSGLWFSRLVIAGLLLMIGFSAISAGQFFARNFMRSMVRVAVLALLVILVGRFWLVDFSDEFAGLGQPASPDLVPGLGEGIVLTPKKARLSTYTYRQRTPTGPENVHSLIVLIDVDGLPEDLSLSGEHTFQALLWDDEPAIRTDERRGSSASRLETFFRRKLSLPTVARDPETIRWDQARLKKANADRAARGLPPLEDFWDRPPDETIAMHAFFPIPESALARIRSHSPAYVTRIEARLARPEIMQQLPLEPGTRGSGASPSLRIVSVDDHVAKLVETAPAFLKHGLFLARVGRTAPRDRLRTEVWSVNRVTGDIDSVSRRSLVPTAISVGGVAISWNEVTLSPDKWIRNGEWALKDPDWRGNTTLVVQGFRVVGRFTRAIRSDRLAVQFPPEAPTAGTVPEGSAAAGAN